MIYLVRQIFLSTHFEPCLDFKRIVSLDELNIKKSITSNNSILIYYTFTCVCVYVSCFFIRLVQRKHVCLFVFISTLKCFFLLFVHEQAYLHHSRHKKKFIKIVVSICRRGIQKKRDPNALYEKRMSRQIGSTNNSKKRSSIPIETRKKSNKKRSALWHADIQTNVKIRNKRLLNVNCKQISNKYSCCCSNSKGKEHMDILFTAMY